MLWTPGLLGRLLKTCKTLVKAWLLSACSSLLPAIARVKLCHEGFACICSLRAPLGPAWPSVVSASFPGVKPRTCAPCILTTKRKASVCICACAEDAKQQSRSSLRGSSRSSLHGSPQRPRGTALRNGTATKLAAGLNGAAEDHRLARKLARAQAGRHVAAADARRKAQSAAMPPPPARAALPAEEVLRTVRPRPLHIKDKVSTSLACSDTLREPKLLQRSASHNFSPELGAISCSWAGFSASAAAFHQPGALYTYLPQRTNHCHDTDIAHGSRVPHTALSPRTCASVLCMVSPSRISTDSDNTCEVPRNARNGLTDPKLPC